MSNPTMDPEFRRSMRQSQRRIALAIAEYAALYPPPPSEDTPEFVQAHADHYRSQHPDLDPDDYPIGLCPGGCGVGQIPPGLFQGDDEPFVCEQPWPLIDGPAC